MEEAEVVARPTTIHDLQIEMHFAILRWIDDRSLGKAQHVCKLWRALTDEWIGRRILIDWKDTGEGLEKMCGIGIRELEVDKAFPNNLLEEKPAPYLKFPHLLKGLSLWERMHPDLFRNLISGTVNLTSLNISHDALEHIRNEDVEQLVFPKLKELTVRRRWDYYEGPVPSLIPLRAFLRENHFKGLTRLGIDLPFKSFQDLEMLKDLFPFIRRHRLMKELDVRVAFPREFIPVEYSSYAQELNSIINGIRGNDWSDSLKKVSILDFGRFVSPQLEALGEFLMIQSSIVELRLILRSIPFPVLSSLCLRNRHTLRMVRIAEMETVDLSAFSTLQCPFRLTVIGFQELLGVEHLSPALEYVCLGGPTKSVDLEHILLHFPNLRVVHLHEVNGNGREEFGLTLQTIQQFVEARKVRRILFLNEGDFPQEGIPNGDPVNPLMLAVTSHGSNPRIWELNEDGYYVSR